MGKVDIYRHQNRVAYFNFFCVGVIWIDDGNDFFDIGRKNAKSAEIPRYYIWSTAKR